MAELFNYKCKACGGALEFDAATQKIKCPYCDSVYEVSDFSDIPEESPDDATAACEHAGDGSRFTGEEENIKVYLCDSCGGEVMTDDTTGATTCPYCGSRLVVKGQFSGALRPDVVIPFAITKEEAKRRYLDHLKGKYFLPKVFKDQNHIEEFRGIYVPFWLYTCDVDARVTYNARKVRVWTAFGREYTETKKYLVKRKGTMSFDGIPYDCSSKIDNVLTEAVEPYDATAAVPFKPAYLAGYFADRYDSEKEESKDRLMQRMRRSANAKFAETVTEPYTSVSAISEDVKATKGEYKYALYPLWLLNTVWRGKRFTFAINGQTGRTVGNLPIDKKAYGRYVGIVGLILSAVFYLAGFLLENFYGA